MIAIKFGSVQWVNLVTSFLFGRDFIIVSYWILILKPK